jgi:hypothetical protein
VHRLGLNFLPSSFGLSQHILHLSPLLRRYDNRADSLTVINNRILITIVHTLVLPYFALLFQHFNIVRLALNYLLETEVLMIKGLYFSPPFLINSLHLLLHICYLFFNLGELITRIIVVFWNCTFG